MKSNTVKKSSRWVSYIFDEFMIMCSNDEYEKAVQESHQIQQERSIKH